MPPKNHTGALPLLGRLKSPCSPHVAETGGPHAGETGSPKWAVGSQQGADWVGRGSAPERGEDCKKTERAERDAAPRGAGGSRDLGSGGDGGGCGSRNRGQRRDRDSGGERRGGRVPVGRDREGEGVVETHALNPFQPPQPPQLPQLPQPLPHGLEGRVWVAAGLGARGLLYHAWLGKQLAAAVMSGQEERIRPEVRSAFLRRPLSCIYKTPIIFRTFLKICIEQEFFYREEQRRPDVRWGL